MDEKVPNPLRRHRRFRVPLLGRSDTLQPRNDTMKLLNRLRLVPSVPIELADDDPELPLNDDASSSPEEMARRGEVDGVGKR